MFHCASRDLGDVAANLPVWHQQALRRLLETSVQQPRSDPLIALRDSSTRGVLNKRSVTEATFRLTSERHLVCRVCREPITTEEHRIVVGGHLVLRRTNPVGMEFEFSCFSEASGAAEDGGASTEHTWFPGYAWIMIICRGCGTHLGWRFVGQEPSFFALILNRLIDCPG